MEAKWVQLKPNAAGDVIRLFVKTRAEEIIVNAMIEGKKILVLSGETIKIEGEVFVFSTVGRWFRPCGPDYEVSSSISLALEDYMATNSYPCRIEEAADLDRRMRGFLQEYPEHTEWWDSLPLWKRLGWDGHENIIHEITRDARPLTRRLLDNVLSMLGMR